MSANPGATEDLNVCDGVDNDCNAATTELSRPCMGRGACEAGVVCGSGVKIVEIAAGGSHTCARRNDAMVLCWGFNSDGQLGDGTTTTRITPVILTL